MALLNRKNLLKKQQLKIEKVILDKDDFVFVREMTGRERDNFEQSLMKETTRDNKTTYERALDDFRAKLAVNTICDENGNLILDKDDYPILSQNMRASQLEKIINTAQQINRISDTDKDNLVKNSDCGRLENSTFD